MFDSPGWMNRGKNELYSIVFFFFQKNKPKGKKKKKMMNNYFKFKDFWSMKNTIDKVNR